MRKQGTVFFLLFFLLLFSNHFAYSQHAAKNDSAKTVRKLSKVLPVKTKRDYRRFWRIYSNDVLFGKLIKGKDSSQVQQLLGSGIPIDSNLFYLTFQIIDPAFNYALLYKISFSHFKVKDNDWYETQFAILFNSRGIAYKLFDHHTRGYNLFDKRKRKSV